MRRRLATVLYRLARHLDPSQEMGVQERHLEALNEVTAELKRQNDLRAQTTDEVKLKKFIVDAIANGWFGRGIEPGSSSTGVRY